MTKAILNEKGFAKNAGWLTVYNYDAETKEFLSETEEWICKDTGIPAHSTTVKPPESREGYVVCKAEFRDGWLLKEDHRGKTVYNTETLESSVVKELGPIAEGFTLLIPNTPHDYWYNNKWVTDKHKVNDELIEKANCEKQRLLTDAKEAISIWQTKLQLDMISAEEKASLIAWLKYIDELNAVCTDEPQAITWPSVPTT